MDCMGDCGKLKVISGSSLDTVFYTADKRNSFVAKPIEFHPLNQIWEENVAAVLCLITLS
jgi:hypothetical protein